MSSKKCKCFHFCTSSDKILHCIDSEEESQAFEVWIRGDDFTDYTSAGSHSQKDILLSSGRVTNGQQDTKYPDTSGFLVGAGIGQIQNNNNNNNKKELQRICYHVSGTSVVASKGKCIHRLSAVFILLNAIRDSCRTILEKQEEEIRGKQMGMSSARSHPMKHQEKDKIDTFIPVPYEESFPSLSTADKEYLSNETIGSATVPNILSTRKKSDKSTTTSTSVHVNITLQGKPEKAAISSQSTPIISIPKSRQDAMEIDRLETNRMSEKQLQWIPKRQDGTTRAHFSSNVATPQNPTPMIPPTNNDKKKSKRRIQPTLATSSLPSPSPSSFSSPSLPSHTASLPNPWLEATIAPPKIQQPSNHTINTTVSSTTKSSTTSHRMNDHSIMDRAMSTIPSTGKKISTSTSSHGEKSSQHALHTIHPNSTHHPWGKLSTNLSSQTDISSNHQHTLPSSEDNDSVLPAQMKRLVRIYCSILHLHLVPSTAIELQLLLRLSSLPTDDDSSTISPNHQNPTSTVPKMKSYSESIGRNQKNNTTRSNPSSSIHRLFQSKNYCQSFASLVCSQLSLWKLGPHFANCLVHFPSLQHHPSIHHIATNLQTVWQTFETNTTSNLFPHKFDRFDHNDTGKMITASLYWGNGNYDDVSNNLITTNASQSSYTALFLTQPFEQMRDSKHNFKSKDSVSAFNNREECRDSFIHQLRTFQEIRGSMLEPSQIERALNGIRTASREIMHRLLLVNFPWFADYFCELLVQIGLVPMQETDKEILMHVADKDKLQKLHNRFTSKATSTKSASLEQLRLNKDTTRDVYSLKPRPETFFPGHQEFFFLFLKSVDSHRFAVHLQTRMKSMISVLMTNFDCKEFEQRLAHLCLLSRFLGFLIFSPSWSLDQDITVSSNRAFFSLSLSNDMHQEKHHDSLPITSYILDGWKYKQLCITIPWIVEFLRMMMWDELSPRSLYYRDVFGLLWAIRSQCGRFEATESYNIIEANRFIIAIYLEGLFTDVVGMAETEKFDFQQLPTIAENISDVPPIDTEPFVYNKFFLLQSSPHLDDLYKLVGDLVADNMRPICLSAASKKLRPLTIGGSTFDPHLNRTVLTVSQKTDQINSLYLSENHDWKIAIQKSLSDSFFHQHKDLKEVCQFVSDVSVRHLSVKMLDILSPMIEWRIGDHLNSLMPSCEPLDIDSYFDLREVEEEIISLSAEWLNCRSKQYIKESIYVLASPFKSSEIIDIAASLAIQHTHQKFYPVVSSYVRSEVKKIFDAYLQRKERQYKQGNGRFARLAIQSDLSKQSDGAKTSQYRILLDTVVEFMAILQDYKFGKENQMNFLKDAYSQPMDDFLNRLFSTLNVFIFRNCPGDTTICGGIVPLHFLTHTVLFISTLRKIGFISKGVSNIVTFLSKAEFLKKVISTFADGNDQHKYDFRPERVTALSYERLEDVYVFCKYLLDEDMIESRSLLSILRNMLATNSSRIVAIRCVHLLEKLEQ